MAEERCATCSAYNMPAPCEECVKHARAADRADHAARGLHVTPEERAVLEAAERWYVTCELTPSPADDIEAWKTSIRTKREQWDQLVAAIARMLKARGEKT